MEIEFTYSKSLTYVPCNFAFRMLHDQWPNRGVVGPRRNGKERGVNTATAGALVCHRLWRGTIKVLCKYALHGNVH